MHFFLSFNHLLSSLPFLRSFLWNLWIYDQWEVFCQSLSDQTWVVEAWKRNQKARAWSGGKCSSTAQCMRRVNDTREHKTAIYGQGTSAWCKREKKEEQKKKFIEAIRKEIDSSMKIICALERSLTVQRSMKYIRSIEIMNIYGRQRMHWAKIEGKREREAEVL